MRCVLLDAELVCVWSVITAAFPENRGTVSKAVCDGRESFPFEASSDASGPNSGGSFHQALVSFFV